METVSLVKELREKGIAIKLVDNQLEVGSSNGDIDHKTLQLLKENKDSLVAYLSSMSAKSTYREIPRIAPSGSYEVSNAQLRIWLESQNQQASIAYHMPFEIWLEGRYDIDALKKAIEYVVDRHEVLRTVFKLNKDQELQQFILSRADLGFEVTTQTFAGEGPDAIGKYIHADINMPFDLEHGPLLRMSILQDGENNLVLFCNLHHIICDAWSIPILKQEIMAGYQAFEGEQQPTLPELKIQYKDYTAWFKNLLGTEGLLKQKQYWLEQYSGEIPTFEFPSKQARPPVKTYNGETLKTVIDEHTGKSIKAYATQNGGSLFMVVLATLNVLLNRYTGKDDLVIGSPFAAREHADLKNQIGFYTNTLALRSKVNGEDTFNEFFRKTKQLVLDSYANQLYPFEELVKELNLKKDASRNPIFDIMLVVSQNDSVQQRKQQNQIDDSTITVDKNTTSKFDFLFYIEEMDEGTLSFKVEYNRDLYDGRLVKELIKNYKKLLKLLLSGSSQKLKDLNYLSGTSEGIISGASKAAYRKETVIKFFEEQVAKTPGETAVRFGDTMLTYEALNNNSNQLAHYLKEACGIGRGAKVGVILGRSHLNVLAMVGSIKSGACYVPIDRNYQQERIAYILNDADIDIILSEEELLSDQSFPGKNIVSLDNVDFSGYSTDNPELVNELDDPSFIIYTSGSTGVPKGVVQTHRMLSNLIQWNRADAGIETGLRHLQYTSFSFDVSLQDCWFNLSSGGSLFITPENLKVNFKALADYICSNRIEVLSFPFSALTNLFDFVDDAFKSRHTLRHIISSGEQLVVNRLVKDFLEQNPTVCLHNHYGPSETHVVTSHSVSAEKSDIPTYVPIGHPLPNSTIYILDQYMLPVPRGVLGEIYVAGENLASGYLNKPELTSERFIPSPFNKGEIIYKTGDLGLVNFSEEIIYFGRNDDQVKIRGYRVELGEINNALLGQEAVIQAYTDVVLKNNEQTLVAYIVTKTAVSRQALRKELSKVLPEYMVPNYIIVLEALPTTSNGKIDKQALPKPDESALVQSAFVEAGTETEKGLVEIWKDILNLEKIGVADNFFELGGHSLKMSQMLNRVGVQYQVELRFELFLSEPTIESLALHIENLQSLNEDPAQSADKKKIII